MPQEDEKLEPLLKALKDYSLFDVIEQFNFVYDTADQVQGEYHKDVDASYEQHVDPSAPRIYGLFRKVNPEHYAFLEQRKVEHDQEWESVYFCIKALAQKLKDSNPFELNQIPEQVLDATLEKLLDCWTYDYRFEGFKPAVEEVLKAGSAIITLKRINSAVNHMGYDDDDKLAMIDILFKFSPQVQQELNSNTPHVSGWEDPIV